MKRVLIIGTDRRIQTAKKIKEFINSKGCIAAQVIYELPSPEIVHDYNVLLFLTRENLDDAEVFKDKYPAKAVIVLCEVVNWEDEDGSVIMLDKKDEKLLETLFNCIQDNGTENLNKGYVFTYGRGRDYSDGYGFVIGDNSALLFQQNGKVWGVSKSPVPLNAVRLRSLTNVPAEVILAFDAAAICAVATGGN